MKLTGLCHGLLLGFVVVMLMACSSSGTTDSDGPDGDSPDGDESDGDEPDGDDPDGDMPDGDPENDIDGDGEIEVETDFDEEIDTASDGDADREEDADNDGDLDEDFIEDSDLDGDVDNDSDRDLENEDEVEGEAEAEVEVEVEVETETEVETFEDEISDGDIDPDALAACQNAYDIVCGITFNHTTVIGLNTEWDSYACDAELNEPGKAVVYKLSVPADNEVTVTLTNLTGELDLFILDTCDTGNCLDHSANGGTADEAVTFLSKGVEDWYTLVVDTPTTSTYNYTLSVACEALVDGDVDEDQDVEGLEDETEEEEEIEWPVALFDLDPASGMTPFFDFIDLTDFYSAPYPNDYYIGSDGLVNLDGFPLPPYDPQHPEGYYVASQYVSVFESLLDGFGNNTGVYFTFPDVLDLNSLPQTAAETKTFSSSILLLDIDPDSPHVGQLLPLEWHWTANPNNLETHGNLLAVSPYDGFPLRPATTYAVILTDGVTGTDAVSIGRTQLMTDLYRGEWIDNPKLSRAYLPLAEWLASNSATLDPDKVRAATVFTTLDPLSETRDMSLYLRQVYPVGSVPGTLQDCAFRSAHDGYVCFSGHYSSPNFQTGTQPYEISGGDFQFDVDGHPVVQQVESLAFAFCVPSDATPPEDGWPLVIVSHGTCGTHEGYIGSDPNDTSTRLLGAKLATIGIDQPLHGERATEVYSCDDLENYSFNFLNPLSARSVLRQGVMDNVALVSFIKYGKLNLSQATCSSWPNTADYAGPAEIPIDTSNLLFHGHSQGGLVGAILAGIKETINGYVLSGSGGRTQITIMERTNPNFLAMLDLVGVLPTAQAYKLHPLFMIIQSIVEVTDPINYAPLWTERPYDDVARNIMVTTGFNDDQTPKNSTYAMATAGWTPLIEPLVPPVPESVIGLELRGIAVESRPATQTVQGPDDGYATSGLCQYPDDGHYAIYQNDDAASMVQEYLRSLAYDGQGQLGGY